ncbi:uncharacterized protein LOC114526098 [Dendronephthya gigantea]|uniref:uncharacterized protein LOC114526098 n=1 Tax=Dendronephthya gigantea TaxID=151771 RepID=UPI00106CE784|nr:uncharacterized protein LOC114526098 [Dendronephthya gigantea]
MPAHQLYSNITKWRTDMAEQSRRMKRFKPSKVRVKTQCTSGKKIVRSITVQTTPSVSEEPEEDNNLNLANNAIGESTYFADTFENALSEGNEAQGQVEQQTLSKHHQRRVKEFNKWEAVREQLLKAVVEEEVISSLTCFACPNEAVCRCLDCGPRQFFCLDCIKIEHHEKNYFHIPEIHKDGCFRPLMINHKEISLKHQTTCPTSQSRDIVCVDQHGFQHKKSISFCSCEPDTVTLVKLQLWPGSAVRPLVAFHFKFLLLAEKFLLESHVSLSKFCDTMGLGKSSLHPKWIQSLYRVLNDDTFDEFRYHNHCLKSIKSHHGEQTNYKMCPLCPQTDDGGILIESMDGCFGLVKKSAGVNLFPPRHSGTFFAEQESVDKFVDDYGKKAEEAPTDCNQFKSGEIDTMLRSKGKNKLFDEKGVFGRVCRHEYPKGFISIKHGERISYSVYEVERMLCNSGDTIDVRVMYDIGCTLSSHLKKNHRVDILERIDLAIPVFHCYGHKSSCQFSYGPRRKKGYGLTDGEGIERLWSYLRGFSSMTKEMSAGRRVDLLTDALVHYAEHRIQQFGTSLPKKMEKTKKLMVNAMLQLEEMFSKLTVSYDADLVESWKKQEESLLKEREMTKSSSLSWQAKYVQSLCQLQELRSTVASSDHDNHEAIASIVKKIKNTLKVVATTEKSYKVLQRWKLGDENFNKAAISIEEERRSCTNERLYSLAVERMFLMSLKKKYADGQAIAAKLSKQITNKTNAIKATVAKYNAALAYWKDPIDGMPEPINFDDVKDPESPSYHHLRVTTPSDDNIPLEFKRSAIDLHNFVERCKEEIEYLDLEMVRLVEYFLKMKMSYQSCCNEVQEEATSVYAKGLNCIFQSRILECDNKLHMLGKLFKDNIREEMKCSIPSMQWKCQSTLLEHEIAREEGTLDVSEYYSADNDDEDDVYSMYDSSDSDSESIWNDEDMSWE